MATPRTDAQTRLGEVLRRVASHRAERVYSLAHAVKGGREIDRLSFLRQDVAGARSHLLRALALVRWVRSNPPLDRLSAATSEATEDRLHGEAIRETARHELVFSAAAKSAPPFDVRSVNGLLSVGYLTTVPRCIVPRGASFTAHPTDVLRLLSSLVRQRMADAGSPMNVPYTVNDGVVELTSPHGWTLCATLAAASPEAPWRVLRAGSRLASRPSLPSSCRTLPVLGPQAEEALVARAQQLVDAADTHFDALHAAASVTAAVHAGLHLHAVALQMRAWQRATGSTHVRSWVSYGREGEADRVEMHFWRGSQRPAAEAGATSLSATGSGACSMVVQVGSGGETTARLTPHVGSLPISTHVLPHLRSTHLDIGSAVEAARALVAHRALVALAACLSDTATGPSITVHRRRITAAAATSRRRDPAAPSTEADGALVAHRLRIRLVHGLALDVTVSPETGALQLDMATWSSPADPGPSARSAPTVVASRKRPRSTPQRSGATTRGDIALEGTCWRKASMEAATRAVRQLMVDNAAAGGGAAPSHTGAAQHELRQARGARLHGAASAAALAHAASESAQVVLTAVHEAATAALGTVVRRAAVLCGAGTPLQGSPQASHSATDALPQAHKDLLRAYGGPFLLRPLSFRAQSMAGGGTETEETLREQTPGARKASVWIRAATAVQGDAEVCLLVSLAGAVAPPRFLLVLSAPTTDAKVSPRFVADLGAEGLHDASSPQRLAWAVARALRRATECATLAFLTAMGSPPGGEPAAKAGEDSSSGSGAAAASLEPLADAMGAALHPADNNSPRSGAAAAAGEDRVRCVLPLRSDLAALLRLRGPAVVAVRAAVVGTHARIRLELPLAEGVTLPQPPRALPRVSRAAFHPPPDAMAAHTPGGPQFDGPAAIVMDHAVNRLVSADDANRPGRSMPRPARTSSVSQTAAAPGVRLPLLATRLRELGEVACSLLLLAPRPGPLDGGRGSALDEVASASAPWSGERPTEKEYAARQVALVRLALSGISKLVDAMFSLVALEPDWLEMRVRNTSVHCAVYLHFEGDTSLGGYSSTSSAATHSSGTLRLACSRDELRSIALEHSVLLAGAALSGDGRSARGREPKAEGQRRGRSSAIGIVSATPEGEGVLAHHSALRVAAVGLVLMALATHFVEARSRLGKPKRSELEPVSRAFTELAFWDRQREQVVARLRRPDEEHAEAFVVFEFLPSARFLAEKAASACQRPQSSTTSHGGALLRTDAEDAVAVARSLASA